LHTIQLLMPFVFMGIFQNGLEPGEKEMMEECVRQSIAKAVGAMGAQVLLPGEGEKASSAVMIDLVQCFSTQMIRLLERSSTAQ
jgi:hypothetical protein